MELAVLRNFSGKKFCNAVLILRSIPTILLKVGRNYRCFFVNFKKYYRIIFYNTTYVAYGRQLSIA